MSLAAAPYGSTHANTCVVMAMESRAFTDTMTVLPSPGVAVTKRMTKIRTGVMKILNPQLSNLIRLLNVETNSSTRGPMCVVSMKVRKTASEG